MTNSFNVNELQITKKHPMITDREIKKFWNFYDIFIIGWFLVSTFFVLSVVAIPVAIVFALIGWMWWPLAIFGMVVPVNFALKYGFGVKNLWFFNDTKDGDFGDPKLLKKYGYENKSKVFKFVWWWFRNHSWNFHWKHKPEWDISKIEEIRVIKQDIPDGNHQFTWCSRDGVHGINYVAYRINGRVMCRFSKADATKEKAFGAGGNHYRFKIAPVFQ